ncbi:hypothetical protein ACKVMT_06575 [Halobacteriales archaeon Cl-PHB]
MSDTGWSLVAEHDEAAALLATLVDLDTDETYTKSELAEASGVALKTLYLVDTLDAFVDVGLLEQAGEDSYDDESSFRLVADSEVLEAARAFDGAVAAQQPAPEAN